MAEQSCQPLSSLQNSRFMNQSKSPGFHSQLGKSALARSSYCQLTTQVGRQSVDRIVSEADIRRGLLTAVSLPIAVIRTVGQHSTH
jgi:hypothetical protein